MADERGRAMSSMLEALVRGWRMCCSDPDIPESYGWSQEDAVRTLERRIFALGSCLDRFMVPDGWTGIDMQRAFRLSESMYANKLADRLYTAWMPYSGGDRAWAMIAGLTGNHALERVWSDILSMYHPE